jgi:hypothetical protein
MTFKLGKVMVPVPALKDGIIIEGLEVSVSDYNLMEGLKVLKELPGIMFELRQVMEMDLDDAPSLGDMLDEQDEMDLEKDMVDSILKDMGAKKVNHPIFGEGMAIPKDNPLLKAFLKHEEEQGKKIPHPLEMLLGGKGGNGKVEHPMASILKDLEAKGILKKKEGAEGKLPWEKPELKEIKLDDILGKLFDKKG